jgi:hypothetical protein
MLLLMKKKLMIKIHMEVMVMMIEFLSDVEESL